MRKYRLIAIGSLTLGLGLAVACSDENLEFNAGDSTTEDGAFGMNGGSRTPGSNASTDGDTGSIDLPPNVTLTAAGTLMCGDALCQCNNGVDDDGDGTVDGFDAECTGGIDDDEATFATGIPGDNRDPKWQDCFFDGNSGAGDDRCRYPTECLTGELPLEDEACSVTQQCLDNCQPRTPNGCDCFGCCAIAVPGGGEVNVLLSESCSVSKIGDPEACAPCTPNPTCENECGECELCPGKTAADLPAHCQPPAPAPDAGVPPQDPQDPPSDPEEPPTFSCEDLTDCDEAGRCPLGQFCSQGCCLTVID